MKGMGQDPYDSSRDKYDEQRKDSKHRILADQLTFLTLIASKWTLAIAQAFEANTFVLAFWFALLSSCECVSHSGFRDYLLLVSLGNWYRWLRSCSDLFLMSRHTKHK